MKYTLDEQREMIRKVLAEKTKERNKLQVQRKGFQAKGRATRVKSLIRQCSVLNEVVVTLAGIPLLQKQITNSNDYIDEMKNQLQSYET